MLLLIMHLRLSENGQMFESDFGTNIQSYMLRSVMR